ncbi:MAG: hypothetical protein J5I94_17560, partial [Phaeodactylibacter sp.]|nr:hypothetical protein [Phaeodactylibacter sp.]
VNIARVKEKQQLCPVFYWPFLSTERFHPAQMLFNQRPPLYLYPPHDKAAVRPQAHEATVPGRFQT